MCCLHIYLWAMHVPSPQEGWKRSSDPLELEFRIVANHYVGARKQTRNLLQEQVPFIALYWTSLSQYFSKTSKISRIEIFCSHVSYFLSIFPFSPYLRPVGDPFKQSLLTEFLVCFLGLWPFEMRCIGDGERLSGYQYLLILQRT